ncbi:MAG TPA: TPM domain-containing protein [Candidatus Acidoferrales bacterium]|nr:TPM domain-containing protein [Candidatus Acidoferrales bacterium]
MSGRPGPRRRLGFAALALAGLALAALTRPGQAASDLAPVPASTGYVNDVAHVIGSDRAAQLESYLDQLHQKTGVQFAVLTVDSCAPEEPDQYKVRVFQQWGIGTKGKDEGLLLLVAMQEHRAVFETGYGLEGTLPDGWQARMLRDLVVPRFREGQFADGITAAVLASAQRIASEKNVTLVWTGEALHYDGGDERTPRIPEWAIVFVLFIVISIVSRLMRRATGYRGGGLWMGGPWLGGGWGGGFGGGGGGGASFGGFGGGSSGGGGGGASW